MIKKLLESCKITPSSRSTGSVDQSINYFNQDFKKRTFHSFLQPHIHLAHTKGFDDNVGRHTVPSHFKLPTISNFIQITNILYNFFITKKLTVSKNDKLNSNEKNTSNNDLYSLHSLLDTDVKFSKSRCSKVLPRAFQAYQDNLPQHYGRTYHDTKLSLSMAVFKMHARGPLFDEYNEILKGECIKHWKNGRQMCELLSLTGNPCTNSIHKGGSEGAGGGEHFDFNNDDNDLPSIEHCSGVRYVCACNCGRCQGPRDDPYNLRHANYDWFQILAKQCGCGQLESIEFPIFQPSTHNFRYCLFLFFFYQ